MPHLSENLETDVIWMIMMMNEFYLGFTNSSSIVLIQGWVLGVLSLWKM